MTIAEARRITAQRLAAVSDEAGLEALLMLSHITGLELSEVRLAQGGLSP